MFGRDIRPPIDVTFGRTPDSADDYSDYVSELRESLEEAHELARTNLGAAQCRQKENYDRRAAGQPYAVGDRVWLYHPVTKKDQSLKLLSLSPWKGPFVVVDRISGVTYRIQPEGGAKRQIVHFNRLKPCQARPPEHDEQVADEAVHDDIGPVAEHNYVPDATDLLYAEDNPVFLFDEPLREPPVKIMTDQLIQNLQDTRGSADNLYERL